MVRRIKKNTEIRKNKIEKSKKYDWVATEQIKNRAPVKTNKRKNCVRNTEINKTDRFSDNRSSLESNTVY